MYFISHRHYYSHYATGGYNLLKIQNSTLIWISKYYSFGWAGFVFQQKEAITGKILFLSNTEKILQRWHTNITENLNPLWLECVHFPFSIEKREPYLCTAPSVFITPWYTLQNFLPFVGPREHIKNWEYMDVLIELHQNTRV